MIRCGECLNYFADNTDGKTGICSKTMTRTRESYELYFCGGWEPKPDSDECPHYYRNDFGIEHCELKQSGTPAGGTTCDYGGWPVESERLECPIRALYRRAIDAEMNLRG